ncbi:DUF4168 domain-containing protein [filamentous cyanobacterium LEGE 11480]|uniref:DUF4168 domain-containing protein n=1 Tax=Romeriopsis navalis LEGE 11480 TaxID=2777977 RepID=A0A928Z3R2_9CYAN|nr:DUF4168 domain-containing protein [Romeriopsis navalis]MBE9030949.1 DUF4168 domain-containing protein [Romeriopsis navalis LEGE 11480]
MASKSIPPLTTQRHFLPKATKSGRLLKAWTISSLSLLTLTTTILLPSPFGQGPAALAQKSDKAILTNETLFTNYVRAAFDIEKQRRTMMGQVKQMTGGTVPGNVCVNLSKLPGGQRTLVKGICNSFAKFASTTVTKKYKLSPKQFNAFQRQTNSPAMRKRINRKIQALKLK